MLLQQAGTFFQFKSRLSIIALFVIYLGLVFAFYFKASNSLLIDDGIVGLLRFEQMGAKGFLNSYKFPSLYYFHDLFNLGVYLVAGKSSVGWFVVMALLHSLNAVMGFVLFRKFYAIADIPNSNAIALAGSLLFLLSPYQTENVVWAATLHYSIALLILLISSYTLLKDLQHNTISNKTLAIITGLFTVSVLTVEISLVFPAIYVVLALAMMWLNKTTIGIIDVIKRVIIPMAIVIVLYFIAMRLIKDRWLPHYGVEHLRNNNPAIYATTIARYVLKLVGFVHFINYPVRASIYEFCTKWQVILLIETAFTGGLFMLLHLLKKKTEAKMFLVLVALSLILLLPSLHMYFMYMFNTENDRLSYFFSIGLYQSFALLFISLGGYIGLSLVFAHAVTGMFYLNLQTQKWSEAGVLHNKLIESFRWPDAPRVYSLNMPTNYKGVYEFRNDERLKVALHFFKNYDMEGKLIPVLSSCYASPYDSTVVTIDNDSTLQVTLITNGGWLMKEFVGAYNHSTPGYTVQISNWGPGYKVIFHNKLPGDVYIYSTGSNFKQLSGF